MSNPNLGRIKNHLEVVLSRLTSAYKGKFVIESFLKAWTQQLDQLENAIQDVMQRRVLTWEAGFEVPWVGKEGADILQDAEGDQLDLIGGLIGEPRRGRTDDEYIAILRVVHLILKSNGTPEDLLAIARAISVGNPYSYSESYPATALLSLNPGVVLPSYSFLARAKPAGVALAMTIGLSSRTMRWAYPPEPSLVAGKIKWTWIGSPATVVFWGFEVIL